MGREGREAGCEKEGEGERKRERGRAYICVDTVQVQERSKEDSHPLVEQRFVGPQIGFIRGPVDGVQSFLRNNSLNIKISLTQ
jgi:hypothetical protein